MKNIVSLIKNLILALIAYFAIKYGFIPMVIFTTIIIAYKSKARTTIEEMSDYLFSISFDLDEVGNVMFAPFLNLTMVKRKADNPYPYGVKGESISSAMGENKLRNTQSKFGIIWYSFLYFIDVPSRKKGREGHCVEARKNYLTSINN